VSVDFAWLYIAGIAIALLGVLIMALSASRGGPTFDAGMHVVWLGVGVVILWVGVLYLTGPVPRQ